MDTLIRLFGTPAKAKILKLFVFNPEAAFDVEQISDRTKESVSKVRKEMINLERMKLLKRRVFSKSVERRKRGRWISSKVRTSGWVLNPDFVYLEALEQFLIRANHVNPKEMARKFTRAGNVKLVIVAGIFIDDPESRVDILIVGDNLKRSLVENTIKSMEAEIGKEIRYAVFETSDFQYRLGLYDKLVRDILDYPHDKVINKLGLA